MQSTTRNPRLALLLAGLSAAFASSVAGQVQRDITVDTRRKQVEFDSLGGNSYVPSRRYRPTNRFLPNPDDNSNPTLYAHQHLPRAEV